MKHELQQLAVFNAVLERILPVNENQAERNFRAAQRRYDNMMPPDEEITHCRGCDEELDIADVRNGNSLCDGCQLLSDRAKLASKIAFEGTRAVELTRLEMEAE